MKQFVNKQRVLVVGHSDADGHLAAEQSRRNILQLGALLCDTFVDKTFTSGQRIWQKYLSHVPIEKYDRVVFVDLMFHPEQVRESVGEIVNLAEKHSEKQIMVIDHHPTSGLPSLPDNLSICFTSIVYACCYGAPSDLMVIASLCENEEEPVLPMVDDGIRRRALGMTRAAADPNIAGSALLKLLSKDRWDIIERLADEPKDIHKRVRGRRHSQQPESPGLLQARAFDTA